MRRRGLVQLSTLVQGGKGMAAPTFRQMFSRTGGLAWLARDSYTDKQENGGR